MQKQTIKQVNKQTNKQGVLEKCISKHTETSAGNSHSSHTLLLNFV